jgi:hypothetical protein
MIQNVTTALQVNATTGNGETLVLRNPRSVTFRIMANGSVTAGAITIECCPQAAPDPGTGSGPGSGSGGVMGINNPFSSRHAWIALARVKTLAKDSSETRIAS